MRKMFRFVSERLEKVLVHLLVHTIYVDNTFITFFDCGAKL